MAFTEKVGQDGLIEMRRTDVHRVPHTQEGIDEIGGDHEITDAESREEHFAEGADVDDAGRVIEALERSDGLSFVAKLGVVVIFDDPCADLTGPVQELEAPRSAHGYAERILVGGSNESGTSIAAKLDASGNVETFGVDGNGDDIAASGKQNVTGKPVAGLFEPDGIAGIEEDTSGEIESLLRATDDHDLLRVAANAARGAEINGDDFAEVLETERLAVFKTAGERIAAVACYEVRPDFERERVKSGLADREWAVTAGPRITFVRRKLQ